MIGWLLLGLAGLYLLGTGLFGLALRAKRAGPGRGILLPLSRLGPWVAVTAGLFFYMLTWSWVGLGFGVLCGLVAAILALGWDEFYDLICPALYACVRREMYAQFSTPIPYFVLFLFVALSGLFFWAGLQSSRLVSMRNVFGTVSSIGFFLFPLLTMGLFSRERSEGTIEMLLTAPVSDTAVAVSKFLGTMVFYLAMLLPTLLYYVILRHIGEEIGKPDPGPVLSAYLGMVLTGAFFVSLGLFTSSLTSSQILAALLAWVLIIIFLLSGGIADVMGLSGTWLGSVLEYMDPIREHLGSFLKGVIDPKDVVYFLSFTVFFLFLSVRAIESSKWR